MTRMDVPEIKRINTIGITYDKGDHIKSHFREVIHNLLGVPDAEVSGIDTRGPNRWLFKLHSTQRYEHIVEHFTGQDYPLGLHNVIRIDDISSYNTRVQLSRVPLEITNDTLTQVMSKFGKVVKCHDYFRNYGDYNNLTHTGERVIWIDLQQHIPQTIYIKQIRNYINVSYEKQPFSCNKCGLTDHNARNCETRPEEFIRVVDLNEHSVEALDIHSDQSEINEILKCQECGYECLCENILKDHMEEHNSSDFLCSECGLQSRTMLELENHMKTHTGEKNRKM